MSVYIDPAQQKPQAHWNPRIIKALALIGAPVMSKEHKRLLNVCMKDGFRLTPSTATAWYINATNYQAVVFVAADISDEAAAHQAAINPEYVVLLPHNITPEKPPFGPWFALCETNKAAARLRDQLMVMRLWQI